MELCGVLKAQDDEDADKAKKDVAEMLAEGAQLEDEEEEEVEEKESNTQESAAEERRADAHSTAAADEKSAMTQ